MKLLLVFLLFLLALTARVSAFSELIPSDNFSVKYENSFWVTCNVVDPYSFQEAVLENSGAMARVQNAKQSLEIAYLSAKVQQTFASGGGPPLYSFLGFQCTSSEVDALRNAVEGASIIARQVDTELEKLSFEIGDNFTGPGSTELIDAREANNPKGAVGETIVKMQRDVAEAAWEIERKNAGKAGQAAISIIETNGSIEKIGRYLSRIQKSEEDVKTLEQVTAGELQENMQQQEDAVQELEQEEVNKLGSFELSQLQLPAQDTIEVDATYATSPAGLLEESKRNLEKAKGIQRSAALFTAKGRTANRITAYRNALKSLAFSKLASEKSLGKTLEVLESVGQRAEEETRLAKNINKPIGRSMALKLISSLKQGDTYFSKISSLNALATNLHNLAEVYSGKVDETEKLDLKIEIRDLQRISKAAVARGIAGAGEIDKSLADIYGLVDSASDAGQLQELESQASEERQILTGLVEDKFTGLRQEFNDAQLLASENSLTGQEEKKLGEVSEAFAGQGQLAEKISDVDQIQSTLNTIIDNALKRRTASLSGNATYATTANANNTTALAAAIAGQRQAQANQTSIQPDGVNASVADVQDLLKQLDDSSNTGLTAFHTDVTAKKTLEQLRFENALKKAQATAKDLQRGSGATASGQKVDDLKAEIAEMDAAIQEAQRKASVEIAIAEQRSNGTNSDVEKAQQSWEGGKYNEALLKAQAINQQAANQQASAKLTGQATSASDEPKLWAIGASLVIILIGAAYLMYTKRNGDNSQQPN